MFEKKMSSSDIKKEGEKALKEIQAQNKKDSKDKKKSDYTKYLERQLAFKQKKYEEQKKKQLERLKQGDAQKHLERAKASITGIKTQRSSSKETDPTVSQKTLENIGSMAGGIGGAAYHGVRYLLAKRKAAKEAQKAKDKQQEKKELGKPGRPSKSKQDKTTSTTSYQTQKLLPGGPDRKRLPPSRKRLPPSGGVPINTPPDSDTKRGMSLGQRARRNPELKKRLISQRDEVFSDWKSEFLFESGLILEVDINDKEKKKKVIDVLRGKNKITINPDISEENVQELAMLIPIASRVAGAVASRGVASKIAGNAASGSIRSKFADLLGQKAGQMTADAVKKKLEKRFTNEDETVEESSAWTRSAGKNPKGGLNEKGRKSYERENPGSDLKAPSKKVGNPRRASFCARMRGMKDRRTSAETARDPDSRINKSLRAWNC